VFQGDRYDVPSGSVTAIGDAALPWFNIACNDDAMWKLFLMRHTQASQAQNITTTREQRTGALRSIRADYCGTGHPYTKQGTDVDWLNIGGWLTHDAVAYPNVEAIWGETGALCLDTRRFDDGKAIACALPSCAGMKLWPDGASMRTYVP
jgi:hypothetical protein